MNGSSRCSGSVEVLQGNSWEPVCAAHWDSLATDAVCGALGCGNWGKLTHLMPPTSELPAGASSGNTSRAGNTTLARAPTVQCSEANWQLCKVADHECDSDRRLVWVTCAGTCACPLPTLPYTSAFNHCSQTLISRLSPPASQVVQTQEFRIDALTKSSHFQI